MLQTGDVIKKLRIKNHYTQSQLAQKLDINLSTLQKYESSKIQNIKIETLRKMCEVLNAPPTIFVFPELAESERRALTEWYVAEVVNVSCEGMKKIADYIDDISKIYRKESE